MSRHNDLVYLWDMREYAARACEYVKGKTFETYEQDDMLRHAVERVVMNIGEAASKVSRPYQQDHPEIPWPKIITQRHRLVHEYGSLEHERIWEVATVHAPGLIQLLDPLLPPPPPDPEPET